MSISHHCESASSVCHYHVIMLTLLFLTSSSFSYYQFLDQDSCQGDSGGPLYDKDNSVLVGVSSWGIEWGSDAYPVVYSRISAQFDWIKSVMCTGHHSNSPVPAWCGTTDVEYKDSPLRMLINGRTRKCNWVEKNSSKRCKKKYVSSHCPATCNECATYQSSDSMKKWKRADNGAEKKCPWVARKNTPGRVVCGFMAVNRRRDLRNC